MASIEQILGVGFVVGGIAGFVLGMDCAPSVYDAKEEVHDFYRDNYVLVHKPEQLEQGYVDTRLMDVSFEDLDGNGVPETILEYEGRRYLFQVEDGRPVAREYKIVPDNPEED